MPVSLKLSDCNMVPQRSIYVKKRKQKKKAQPPSDRYSSKIVVDPMNSFKTTNRKLFNPMCGSKTRTRKLFVLTHRQLAHLLLKALPLLTHAIFLESIDQLIAAKEQEPTTSPCLMKTPVSIINQAIMRSFSDMYPCGVGPSLVLCGSGSLVQGEAKAGDVFILDVIVNRRHSSSRGTLRKNNDERFRETILLPTCASRAMELEENDSMFATVIIYLPATSVFYCWLAQTEKMQAFLPLPSSWLRLQRKDGVPASGSYIKSINNVWHLTLPSGLSPPYMLTAFQFSDDHEYAPLLPPDVWPNLEGLVVPPEVSSNPRQRYKLLLDKSPSNKKNCRCYVKGALHLEIPSSCLIINHMVIGDIDLKVCHHDKMSRVQSESWVLVRRVLDSKFLRLANGVGDLLARNGSKGNTRQHTGDQGGMYGLGDMLSRCGHDVFSPKVMHHIPHFTAKLSEVCLLARSIFESIFPVALKTMQSVERDVGIFPSDAMGGNSGVTCSMDVSIDLGNATHYDVGDGSVGFSVWTELKPGQAKNWYFVLPNVLCRYQNNTYHGVAIQLFHGVAISWDGRVLRHGTTITDVGEGNHTFGTFWKAGGRLIEKHAE